MDLRLSISVSLLQVLLSLTPPPPASLAEAPSPPAGLIEAPSPPISMPLPLEATYSSKEELYALIQA